MTVRQLSGDFAMADKEIREIHTSSDGGATGMVVGIVLVAALVLGGFFLWNYAGNNRTASGPNVTITTPSTTGQGGGGMGGGGSK
jgi:hypothetical protein